MSEAAARRWQRGAHGRWAPLLFAAGALAIAAAAVVLAAPLAFDARLIGAEVAAQLRATVGLKVETRGAMRFALLPRPHVVTYGIEVSDPTQTLAMTADELRGDVRLLPLLVGRVELTSATLRRPRLTVDLDGRQMKADSTIGRALRGPASDQDVTARPLGAVTFVDGQIRIVSRRLSRPIELTSANVTVDWPDVDSPATLTGAVSFESIATDVALWLAQPSMLLRGAHSAMTLSIHSAPLDLTASGELSNAAPTSFRGHLSASAPSGADLIALAGGAPPPARLANLALTSDVVASAGRDGQRAIDLPNLDLRADENDYEGTLSIQTGADKPLVSGTLASDHLSLAPFLHAMPPLLDSSGRWSTAPLARSGGGPVDLDLRISASHLRLEALSIDDAALGIITRQDRTEVGLIEGKAYGGTVKGRVSFGHEGGLGLRGAGSFDGVDLATLSWDALGRQIAAGRLAGGYTFEADGRSTASLAASLRGSLKATAIDGELSTINLAGSLLTDGVDELAGRTLFKRGVIDLHIERGRGEIDEGVLETASARLSVAGRIDVAERTLRLKVENASSASGGASAPLIVTGDWARPHVERETPVPHR